MKKYIGLVLLLFSITALSAQTVYLADDFEDGNMDGWVDRPDSSWAATSNSPITGSYSLQHSTTDTAGGNHLHIALSGMNVSTDVIRWRFNLKSGNFAPSTAEKFWVYLMLNDTTNVSGYAVGVNLGGTSDTLTLWKVTGSTADGEIVRSRFKWGLSETVGIEVTRDTSGLWELKYDTNGGFDNLVTAGSAMNKDYLAANYFGASFYFKSGSRNKLWIDDLRVESSSKVTANTLAFLEGPFDTDHMNTALQSAGDLPVDQPFAVSPWNYSGAETVLNFGTNVVDWVLVQLRTGTDSTSTVATRAALLLSDGTIADVDGSSAVSFSGIAEGAYYIVIRPRNHLAVMSATAVTLSQNSTLYNFSTSAAQAYGSAPQVEVVTGVFALITGDANGNGQIQTDDNNDIWEVEVGTAGYKKSDYNLNGQVQTDDKNDFWNSNVGKGTQVPF